MSLAADNVYEEKSDCIFWLQVDIAKHLLARVIGLILLPLLLYITIFAIHFVVLNKRYVADTLITAHLTEYCNDDSQSICLGNHDCLLSPADQEMVSSVQPFSPV